MTGKWRWLIPVIVTAVVLAGCSSPSDSGSPGSTSNPVSAAVPTIVVVDASESMRTADAPGARWDAARDAASALAQSLPSGTELGVVTFGSQMAAATTPQQLGCTDVRIAVPMAEVDPGTVKEALDVMHPQGFTPIGAALEQAATMLPPVGPASIVVISDGESTCLPDPCETAARIRTEHPDATISAIGFKTDAAALACIAQRGRGVFLTADNAAQLTARLQAAQDSGSIDTRLAPASRGGANIGDTIAAVAAAVPGFPQSGRREADRTVIVWRECTYIFDEAGRLIEIAPGTPAGSAGTTIDGLAAGTPGARAVELYGNPVEDESGTAIFVADEKAGTGYRVGYRDGGSVQQGTVTTVTLCGCLPERYPTSVVGHAVTLSPSSRMTFGGVGGVYLGDRVSKIPETYVEHFVADLGALPPGTIVYFFRPRTSSGWSDAVIEADPSGTIREISWYATDRGVGLGSTQAEVRRAYSGFTSGQCKSSGGGLADFYLDPATGRNVIVFYDAAGTVVRFVTRPSVTDGENCGVE